MEDKELKLALAEVAKDETKRKEFAELIVEYINPNHFVKDFVGLLLNTRTLKPGDALVKKVRKGIKVRTLVPGSETLASEITLSERMNYVLDGAVVSVTANEWDLERGEIGTIDDLRRELLASLKDFYVYKVFTALSSVWNAANTPSNYTAVAGSLTATALKDAIQNINNTTGGVRAVVGTRSALTPITEFGNFVKSGSDTWGVPDNIREIMKTGFLGEYYGAKIVALEQQYDNPDDYNAMIPDNLVLVIGENVGDFVLFGEPKADEWTDKSVVPPQWYLRLYQQFGMIVDKAMGIHVIEIT